MANFIQRVMNPAWYHGHGVTPPFFEGWYYKLISKDEQHKWAIIPGVFVHEESTKSHAFVQVLNGTTGESYYHDFGVFHAEADAFDILIGNRNNFSLNGMSLNIDDKIGAVSGDLQLGELNPWPVGVLSPGVMGRYGWLPNLECYHGVLSFDHELTGKLNLYGEEVDFTGGRGYMEKDWGQAFPDSYIWMQSNHFDTPDTCLTASVATIPKGSGLTSIFISDDFVGFIVGLWHQGTLHSFSTYNDTKIDELTVDDTTVTWVLYRSDTELRITCHRAKGGLLNAPQRTDMDRRVSESMQASIEVELYEIFGPRKSLIYKGTGRNAGLEVVGDLSLILQG